LQFRLQSTLTSTAVTFRMYAYSHIWVCQIAPLPLMPTCIKARHAVKARKALKACTPCLPVCLPPAFIKLASIEAAHTAIKALHNSKLGGRTIIVKSADQDCEYGEDVVGAAKASQVREEGCAPSYHHSAYEHGASVLAFVHEFALGLLSLIASTSLQHLLYFGDLVGCTNSTSRVRGLPGRCRQRSSTS
jgi:hypothetical protein